MDKGIGGGLWVVRYRNKSSKPMKLPKAKTYALEMVRGVRPGRVIADPIGRPHRLHLYVHEPMSEMAQIWAIETADYPVLYVRHLGKLEASNRHDYHLEYSEDGYPKLLLISTLQPETKPRTGVES